MGNTDLAKIIKEYRTNLNLTQVQFAERIGIGLTTLISIETGKQQQLSNKILSALSQNLPPEQYEQVCRVVITPRSTAGKNDVNKKRAVKQSALEKIASQTETAGFMQNNALNNKLCRKNQSNKTWLIIPDFSRKLVFFEITAKVNGEIGNIIGSESQPNRLSFCFTFKISTEDMLRLKLYYSSRNLPFEISFLYYDYKSHRIISEWIVDEYCDGRGLFNTLSADAFERVKAQCAKFMWESSFSYALPDTFLCMDITKDQVTEILKKDITDEEDDLFISHWASLNSELQAPETYSIRHEIEITDIDIDSFAFAFNKKSQIVITGMVTIKMTAYQEVFSGDDDNFALEDGDSDSNTATFRFSIPFKNGMLDTAELTEEIL